MGLNLLNYHVDIGPHSLEQAAELLTNALRSQGYERIQEAEGADMVFDLLHKSGTKWLAICEKGVECLSISDMKKEVRTLAHIFSSTAVCSMVYDSDVLAMALYSVPPKKNNLVVMDDENKYAEDLEYNPKTSKGNASIWCAAAGLENPAILKSLWAGEYVLAENKLREIGNLLGFGETACCSPEQPERPDGYLHKELAFSSIQSKMPPYSIITEGPPVINFRIFCTHMVLNERTCLSFHNSGGPHTGACFYLQSDLFATEALKFSEVTLARWKEFKQPSEYTFGIDKIIHTASFIKTQLPDGKWVMIAHFPDFPIPEGIRENYRTAKTWKQTDDARYAREMTVRFTISGDETIRGKVRVHLLPLNDDNNVHRGYIAEIINRRE